MKVNLVENVGFTTVQKQKLDKALPLLEEVLTSLQFKNAILNYTRPDGTLGFYFRKRRDGTFIDAYHTNQQVYDKLMAGKEQNGNVADNQCDLYLHVKQGIGKDPDVVGYGYPGKKRIYTYGDWLNKRTFTEVNYAGHILHEWCHKLGFTHRRKRNTNRRYSVPYRIRRLFEAVYNELHPEPDT
jgi:hypothetical protein